MTRKTPEKKPRSVEARLDEMMTALGVPVNPQIRAELSDGVQARLGQLVDSGYRDLRWGDMRICLRLEIVAWRARNRPPARKAGAGGANP